MIFLSVGSGAVVALSVVCVVLMRAMLQRKVRNRRTLQNPDSIDELAAWRIGGIDQWVQLRGARRSNPILLYVHGGPGLPVLPFSHAFQKNWEEQYIVVHWDQRNTGKTLTSNGVQTVDLTLDLHVSDGLEIVTRLQELFPNNPLVLLGHSWGTAVATGMILRDSFDCAAYIGVGQVSDFLKSEEYGFATVLEEAKRRNQMESVTQLLRYADYPHVEKLAIAMSVVRKKEIELGFGHHGNPRIMLHLIWLAFQSPDYCWRDLLSLFRPQAQAASIKLALKELPLFAGRVAGSTLRCPIIMVGGEFDLFTPTPLARDFLDSLHAPRKEFIELKDVAHFGPIEAPDAFDSILLQDVLSLISSRHREQEVTLISQVQEQPS